MVFSSQFFVFFFLPVALLGHTLFQVCSMRGRGTNWEVFLQQLSNSYLLLCSIVFYAWGEPRLLLVMIASCFLNYFFGLFLAPPEDAHSSIVRKTLFVLAIAGNLGILGFYKYFNFFVEIGGLQLLNKFLPASWAIGAVAKVALPLGISFYTFQGMSYVFDVWRGDVKPTKNPVTFACYLTMFPQLVAGPIVRYSEVEEALYQRNIGWDRAAYGVSRFIVGLAKKMLIANTVAKVADAAFRVPDGQLTFMAAWLGILCYTLQIYYDFSGYSDMAIGMGHMMGFTFPENFTYPYIARSIRDYWRRWHITLSVWFRDYLYIPLGGNRYGTFRTALNLFIVFFLCGLWHGASWMFVAWGAYHGLFLVFERFFPSFTERLPRPLAHMYTILVFIGGWVLFRAPSFSYALSYYESLIGRFSVELLEEKMVWFYAHGIDVQLALVAGIFFSAPVAPAIGRFWQRTTERCPLYLRIVAEFGRITLLLGTLFVCFMFLVGSAFNPFIYFRF